MVLFISITLVLIHLLTSVEITKKGEDKAGIVGVCDACCLDSARVWDVIFALKINSEPFQWNYLLGTLLIAAIQLSVYLLYKYVHHEMSSLLKFHVKIYMQNYAIHMITCKYIQGMFRSDVDVSW